MLQMNDYFKNSTLIIVRKKNIYIYILQFYNTVYSNNSFFKGLYTLVLEKKRAFLRFFFGKTTQFFF